MPARFEWQTEVEEEWEPGQQVKVVKEPANKPPWRAILILLFACLGGILLIWGRVKNQVSEAEIALREEVLATHRLIESASI